MSTWVDNEEIQLFREFLRIRTVPPNIDYEPCVEFLKRQAESMDLPINVYHPADSANPLVVITWQGTEPELPSIVLNSHTDVVPVFEELWSQKPFAADMDEEGRIYARGAQDMKCVAMQYLAAIRSLKKDGHHFKRTIHVLFVPEPCVAFLKQQAKGLGLPVKLYYPTGPRNPLVVLTWVGQRPELPSIILNSHMDVVPVFEEHWTHPPFSADIDAEGRIFARGSQDMKCVGMQYMAAIRALKRDGKTFKRTIHIVFVPDEERGGKLGMKPFVKTEEFKALNAGFALDEGIASPVEEYPVFYGERSIWHIYLKISGTPGHGSILHKATAGEKLRYMVDKFMDMRKYEAQKLENNPDLLLGDVTTINLVYVNGGVQSNVVPPLMTVGFDIRIALDKDHIELENTIKAWCAEAGGGIEIEFDQKDPYVVPTKLDDSNPFWGAFKSCVEEKGLKIRTQVFPGGTDSRFLREVGVPAIGFSPMNHTPVLLHDHDEFLKAETYLNGIEIYKSLIPKIANV